MTERRNGSSCARLEEALEPYVDGELKVEERRELESHLEACSHCRDELALATEVRDSLRRLPNLEAPRPTVAAVLETARAEAYPRWRNWLAALRERPVPMALAATAAALVVAIGLALFPAGSGELQTAADDPAVVRATLEAKLALAHFARANRRIGLGLGEDVLRARVLAPATRGVARSLALESGGGRDPSGEAPEGRG